MSKDQQYNSQKLSYQLKILDGKIFVKPLDQCTHIFLTKTWTQIVSQLFDQTQLQKLSHNFVQFKEIFLFKDLKCFMQTLQNRFQSVRHCSSSDVYQKGLQNFIDKVFNIKIAVPGPNGNEEKRSYKDFIICYDILQIMSQQLEQSSINFGTDDPNTLQRLGRKIFIKKVKQNYFLQQNQVELIFPKVRFLIYYMKDHYSKIKQVLRNLEQNRQQWLLYPLSPYFDQFSLDKIYYEELIQKILIKKSSQIKEILEKFAFQLVNKNVKVFKQDFIDKISTNIQNFELQEGYYLGFHVFGQVKNYYNFYLEVKFFFENRRMWILRPQKICCCSSLADLQDFLKDKQNLESYLISDHMVVIIKSQKDLNRLTSVKYRQNMIKNQALTQEDRLMQVLQTGEFFIDINDFDQQDLEYIYKQRQRYKKFLQNQFRVKVEYLPASNRRKIYLLCEISGFRIFKGNLYRFISEYKKQKEHLKQFNSPFSIYIFNKFFRQSLEKEFPLVKFTVKKKTNLDQVWVKFYSKDRAQLMEKVNQMMKKFQLNLDYIVCKKQPLPQNWFCIYKRPHLLSIQTLTCRKYLISKDTKVFVQPYQSLSKPVDEMLYLIDQSFQNCWEFIQIAQQNDINYWSLFFQFNQKKTKKPDRIKAIPLQNHRYISKMLLWYNDMLKKIESRRQQDIKRLYKRYENKKQMHIMIPRHATSSILLNFVLPSFVKEFTQQTGYNLKEIYFYYPILFDIEHRFIQNITLKVIDQQMKKANIELQNQIHLSQESIKKISQMEFLNIFCSFEGDQRIWRTSNLSSYVFYIERELLIQRKTTLLKSVTADVQEKLNNFKIPLFFMDDSFKNQIIVDIAEGFFYKVAKVRVQGPILLKSDRKYDEITKCVHCIKNIFKSLSYVVLYIDQDFHVSKNGYFYSHKQFVLGKNIISKQQQQPKNIKKNQPQTITANANITSLLKSQTTQENKASKDMIQNSTKIALNPMKLQLTSSEGKRASIYEDTGKILKRDSKRLIIQIIESEMVCWYMVETFNQKVTELQQYLKNPNNYKSFQNNQIGVGDISQYSILDLKQQSEQSKFLDIGNQVSTDKFNLDNLSNIKQKYCIESFDLSVIHFAGQGFEQNQNKISEKMSILEEMENHENYEIHDMSICSGNQ